MLKRLFSITASLLICGGLYAQQLGSSNTVIEGANGAKTVIIGKATAGFPEFLSEDARYISGVFGGSAGFAYDFDKDSCIILMQSTLPGYISANHYAGQDDPGETYSNSYTYYNGTKYELEKVINSEARSYNEVFITKVQGNGERIVTMIYDEYTSESGSVKHMNRAAIHDGKTGKCLLKLPFVWNVPTDEDSRYGFGSRADCISGDGQIVAGHSTNPYASGKWSLAFWDISDTHNIKVFGLGENANISGLRNQDYSFGSFYGINYDGTLIVGGSESNGMGVIIHYDRANKAVSKIDTVLPLPSWDFLTFTDISDDGIAVGYCGMHVDPGTREPIVYSELSGLVKMTDFLYEYYDIDVRRRELYTPMLISRNGLRMIGFYYESGYPVPYSHELSATRIPPRVRKISARAARGERKAVIAWQRPLNSDHKLVGYNIYLDEATTPLNGATPLAANEESYTDETVPTGKHIYHIEAVYEDVTSDKQPSNTIQVVGPGAAFPVQSVNHRVDYNRFAYIYWGQPSSEVVTSAKSGIATISKEAKGQFEHAVENAETTPVESKNALQPKSYINTTLDYIDNVDMLTFSGYVAIKIGDYTYVSSHLGGGITVIDQFNEKVDIIHPKDLGIVMSMVYLENEGLLYCGTSKDIKVLDLKTKQIKDNFPNITARFLAYVPDMKDGRPGLVAGDAHHCNTYLWDEVGEEYVLDQKDYLDFSSLYANGAAYHDGRLYVASASGPYYNEVYVYDFAKKERIGEPIQVVEDPAMYNLLTMDGNAQMVAELPNSTQAGGLSICKMEDGSTALGMVFQCMYMTSQFMLLEVESADNIKGYDLYRSFNGGAYAKVNDAPMTSRRYTETLTQAGKYTYYVVVKSENADDSEKSPIDTLTIYPYGNCPEPDFTAKESNRWAVLEWMPAESDKSIVGFDLYRGDEHIGKFWENDIRLDYTDQVTEPGTYNYRLEVLYMDGCLSEGKASVTITGQGLAKEPFGLTLRAEGANKTQDHVFTKWETPMFEEPMALSYCNGIQPQSIAFDNFYECWAAIGWNKKDLEIYKDLYVVGLEYVVGAIPNVFEAIIILNDKIVYSQSLPRPVAKKWQTVMFDRSFSMDQPQEVAVGYHVKYSPEANGVLVIDPTVNDPGKGDIVSLDNKTWTSLKAGGQAGNWMMRALVVHKRDLDAAKRADGSFDEQKLAGSIMRLAAEQQPLNAEIKTLPTTFDVKPSAKNALNLLGFNIYRQAADAPNGSEVKLNYELLTTLEYTDWFVPVDDYEYLVGAVYADGQEIKASQFIDLTELANEEGGEALSLNVYPNPATEWINVEGEYETLQIFDFGGRLLRTVPAAKQISLGDLKPGTYMLHFTGADAQKAVYKIVVR